MYFESIEIQNFKGINKQKIMFRQGMNIILGENGTGKTSILEALTIALGDYFGGIKGVSRKGILQPQVRFKTHLFGQASTAVEYCYPTIIDSTIHLDREFAAGRIIREGENGRTKFQGKAISSYSEKLTNDANSVLPVLCYFSTQRMAQAKREDFGVTSKNDLNDRRCGYIGCMDDSLDRKALEAWCLKMEQISFKKNMLIPEYENLKTITSIFMKSMNDLPVEPQIYYSRVFDDMVYSENGVETPVKYLSAGYQSLLWIVMTIAFRLCLLNPGVRDYKTVPGIVMIDEVDMHLHPQWQWRILDALTETFPAIQFIVTTHAPIIISSCRDANLVHIDSDQSIYYLPSAYAQAIDDVAELTQGSSGIPANLKKLRKEFDQAFRSGNTETANNIYQSMLKQYGSENTEVDLAKRRLSIM